MNAPATSAARTTPRRVAMLGRLNIVLIRADRAWPSPPDSQRVSALSPSGGVVVEGDIDALLELLRRVETTGVVRGDAAALLAALTAP